MQVGFPRSLEVGGPGARAKHKHRSKLPLLTCECGTVLTLETNPSRHVDEHDEVNRSLNLFELLDVQYPTVPL